MAQLVTRVEDLVRSEMEAINRTYGGTLTTITENALDDWLKRFRSAKPDERLRMIIRPVVRSATVNPPKGKQKRRAA